MSRTRDGLYRRENGIFAFRYKDDKGNWREKYTGTVDRVRARQFRNDFLREVEHGTLPTEMADWKFSQAESWWHEYRKNRIAKNTMNSERYRLQHLPRICGDRRLKQISNALIDSYVSARLREGIGAHSINKEVMLWSLILKKAKLWARLRDDYRPLKTKASDIGRALTRDELRHLSNVARTNPDWAAAFFGSVLAANAGLRGGEIKRSRIGAVDLENRHLRIERKNAKSEASARQVELNNDATEAAAQLLKRAALLGALEPEHYLMPKFLSRVAYGAEKGLRGYDPTQHQVCWDSAWSSLTRAAGLPGLRFHDLRHTFITHLVQNGVPLPLIQAMVGHISPRMVLHYTHISSGAARKVVEVFDKQPMLVDWKSPDSTGRVQ